MSINPDRLWTRLNQIGSIDPRGGISRFAWTKEYKESAGLLISWMKLAGMSVRVDTVGNIYGRLEGSEDLPAILTGSHLDTVPCGGKFDGIAGIMSALEAITSIKENKISNKHPLEMIAFINEEASQFLGGHFGSKAICGMLPDDYAKTCVDKNTGITMHEAMINYGMGLNPDNFPGSYIKKEDYYAFLELHIEQGKYLLQKDFPIAVVSSIAGIKQFYITLKGVSAHAGGMAMRDRHDCIAAAAEIACEVERLALTTGSDTRGTVGYISAHPGEHNIIADEAVIPVDIREEDDEIFEKIYIDLMKFVKKQCEKRGLTYSLRITLDTPPAHCHDNLIKLISECANKSKVPFINMVSYPAHDAMQMARLLPMGMIFVRSSNDGVSHCPDEYTTKEDMTMATQVLYNSLIELSLRDILV